MLTTRKVITGVLVVVAVLSLFLLFYHFIRDIILIFSGVVIGVSMSPTVEWLRKRKLPRSLSVILIYSSIVVVFVGIIFLIVPQSTQQISSLAPRFADMYGGVKSYLQNSPYPFVHQLASNLPASLNAMFASPPAGRSGTPAGTVNSTLNLLQSFLMGIFIVGVVLLVGFYWTMEGERVEVNFLMFFPVEKRDSTRELIKDIENRVGGFVRGQGLLAIAIALMDLVAYFIIGLPSFISLALIAGACELIPFFGPTLGAIPALLVAGASDPTRLLWVIVATFIVQMLENHLLNPRIMQKTVGVNPIVVILSITGFGFLFGFYGLLMAIPLAAVIQVVIDRSVLHPPEPKIKAPVGRDRISQLSYEAQEFIQDIRKRVRHKETEPGDGDSDEIEDAIESIATDLGNLLAENNQPDKAL